MTVAATVDVLLAVGLCVVLWRTYLEVVSGIAGTNSYVHAFFLFLHLLIRPLFKIRLFRSGIIELVQRVVLLTINTGIWTALFAVLTMATVRAPSHIFTF
jgi:hypothetical protein